jgi:Holliday junction resolvase
VNIDNDIDKIKQGFAGEKRVRDYLIKNKVQHMQVDLIIFSKGKYKLFEIKHQEKYEPPPFEGHGLPIWQVESRVKFYEEFGIEPFLFVVDKKDGNIYFESIINLENTEYFDTVRSKRRIYNIKNFKILKE